MVEALLNEQRFVTGSHERQTLTSESSQKRETRKKRLVMKLEKLSGDRQRLRGIVQRHPPRRVPECPLVRDTRRGNPAQQDVFVTNAASLNGMNVNQIAAGSRGRDRTIPSYVLKAFEIASSHLRVTSANGHSAHRLPGSRCSGRISAIHPVQCRCCRPIPDLAPGWAPSGW
jgi:hypothetical protein